MELDAILAVTLGGTLLTGGRFSLAGSVLGALIIQTLTSTIYSIGVPPEINLVVKAGVVFVVMLLQSAEFRARRARAGSGAERPRDAPRSPRRAPRRIDPRLRAARSARSSLFLAHRRLRLGRLPGFFSPQVFLNLLIDNAFLCIVARRHDVRDPLGRHRPVGGLGDRADDDGLGGARRAARTGARALVIPLVLAIGTAFGALHGLADRSASGCSRSSSRSPACSSRAACATSSASIRSASPTPRYTADRAGARAAVGRERIAHRRRADRAGDGRASASSWRTARAFGRTVYAIGGSETSALLMGLPVARTTVGVYALQRLLLGARPASSSPSTCSRATACTRSGLELDAIAAVVIGGTLLSGGVGYVDRHAVRRADPRHHPDADHLRRLAQLLVDADRDRRAAVRVLPAATPVRITHEVNGNR